MLELKGVENSNFSVWQEPRIDSMLDLFSGLLGVMKMDELPSVLLLPSNVGGSLIYNLEGDGMKALLAKDLEKGD